jgi:opacity protein-like surface antigen
MKTAIIGVVIALIAGASPALAQLYVAADYANLHEPNSTVPSVNLAIGDRLGQYFGFEGGYEGAYSHIPFSGAYLVGTLYLPFGRTGFEAFADGGGLVVSGETPQTGGFTRWSSGFRADAGLIYDISPVLGIRAAYRFQTPLAHMTAETVGFTYSF